jgi:hypothetical protein
MSSKPELIWSPTEPDVETVHNLGNRRKPDWQITVELDVGFTTMNARSDALLPFAEGLSACQRIEASGQMKSRKAVAEAKRPIFLDPTEQLHLID